MPRGNPAPKLTITVDPDIHAAAQKGVSVSAWMTAAARLALTLDDGLRAVAEWEEEHGHLTGAEMNAARASVAARERAAATGRRAA